MEQPGVGNLRQAAERQIADRPVRMFAQPPDMFGNLLASGLTMMLALEAVINIAGVMGLIPLKGLALPFLSYGGTSLIMSLVAVGILLNISTYDS